MRLIATLALACLLSTGLAACDPPKSAGQVAVTADTDLTKAETAYADAKAWAELFIPLLSADKVALIRKAEGIADIALATARGALTIAEREAALKKANAATSQIDAATPAVTS